MPPHWCCIVGDLELDHLRRRLRETEEAMERIYAQLAKVPLKKVRASKSHAHTNHTQNQIVYPPSWCPHYRQLTLRFSFFSFRSVCLFFYFSSSDWSIGCVPVGQLRMHVLDDRKVAPWILMRCSFLIIRTLGSYSWTISAARQCKCVCTFINMWQVLITTWRQNAN